MYSFVHETYLSIVSTANRAKYNKAQARATLNHMLQVRFILLVTFIDDLIFNRR